MVKMGLNQTPKLGEHVETPPNTKSPPPPPVSPESAPPPAEKPQTRSILPPGIRLLERFSLRPKTISAIFVTCCFASLGGAAEATKWLAKSINNQETNPPLMGAPFNAENTDSGWERWDVYNPVGYHKIVEGYLE